MRSGDYIYEYGTAGSIGRNASKGRETATLDDYRKRYAQYRTDQDLVEMHRLLPIIAIWDDHETANNDWKAGSSNSNDSIATGGCAFSNDTICFTERAINAKRAYHEWIPLRQVDLQDEGRIWREFNFGDLIDLYALDTRCVILSPSSGRQVPWGWQLVVQQWSGSADDWAESMTET